MWWPEEQGGDPAHAGAGDAGVRGWGGVRAGNRGAVAHAGAGDTGVIGRGGVGWGSNAEGQ